MFLHSGTLSDVVISSRNVVITCGIFVTLSHCDSSFIINDCICPWTETDNEKFKCNFIKQSEIKKLCINNDTNGLKLLSQHYIKNAFDTIVTGYHIAGINALIPAKILYQMFLGLMEYALTTFFEEFGNM